MAEYVLDLTEGLLKAGLLLFFFKDSIILKEKYRSIGRVLFFLQSFLMGQWMSHSVWLDRMLYMDASGRVNNSSYSIVKLALGFGVSFLVMDLLYQGRKIAKLYLLLVFYTVQEMSRFIVHSAWSLGTSWYIDYLCDLVEAQRMEPETFYVCSAHLQLCSYAAFAAGYLLLMYVTFRLYRRYLTGPVDEISRQGLWFLMLAPIIGMAFDVLWRISFFSQKGAEIEFMYEKHGSMYVVVPVIALLCLMCTLFSRKIYSDLMRSEEQKNGLLFYRQQMADMTAHVKELELLYDGIRGMRHDINNYVADMEQLLWMGTQSGQMPEQIRQEAGEYLLGMQQAAARLCLQFSTGNAVTDVILNRKGQICAQEQIEMEGDLLYPAQLGIEAFDLGILLNNALDNAIEACRNIAGDRERWIRFRGYVKGRMFFLVVENSYDSRPIQSGGEALRTTKADEGNHGLGMSNMRSCVEKYYGTMQYEAQDGRFTLTLMLQGEPDMENRNMRYDSL